MERFLRLLNADYSETGSEEGTEGGRIWVTTGVYIPLIRLIHDLRLYVFSDRRYLLGYQLTGG